MHGHAAGVTSVYLAAGAQLASFLVRVCEARHVCPLVHVHKPRHGVSCLVRCHGCSRRVDHPAKELPVSDQP